MLLKSPPDPSRKPWTRLTSKRVSGFPGSNPTSSVLPISLHVSITYVLCLSEAAAPNTWTNRRHHRSAGRGLGRPRLREGDGFGYGQVFPDKNLNGPGARSTWPSSRKEEAHNWVLGVRVSVSRGRPRGRCLRPLIYLRPLSPPLVLKPIISFYFQAVRLLRVSADLESRSCSLRKEALQCLTITLAGSDTRKFWELMTAFFGTNQKGDEEDPWDFIDPAPAIPPPLPLTDTESEEDVASVRSAPASTKPRPSGTGKPARRAKVAQQKDMLKDLCSLQEAIRIYPADADSLKETGIPAELQVKREHQTTHAGASVYLCRHPKCQTPPFFAQSPAGIYSHIRRKHPGIAVACPYCPGKLYWNTKGWKAHLDTRHRGAPAYGTTLADEAALAEEMLTSAERSSKKRKPRRRQRKAAKAKAKTASPSPPSSSDHTSATSDSSPDSSSDTGSSTNSSPVKKQKKSGSSRVKPLTEEQVGLVMEGATALLAEPTPESDVKQPVGLLAPQPKIVARRESQVGRAPETVAMAAALVLADKPKEEETEMEGIPEDTEAGSEDTPPHYGY